MNENSVAKVCFISFTTVRIFCLILSTMAKPIVDTNWKFQQQKTNWKFPQQKPMVPMAIKDKQSIGDKLKVMMLIKKLQRKMEIEFGVRRNLTAARFSTDYLFEGDIIIQPKTLQAMIDSKGRRQKRKITMVPTKLWNLPIPYSFDRTLNSTERRTIESVLGYWETHTCINFTEKTSTNSSYILFKKEDGCWSYVGDQRFGGQPVSIGEGCAYNGIVSHEVGHVIGFWHEHARPDRDDHISIVKENIDRTELFNFNTGTWGEMDNKGVPYDVGSLLHYSAETFARSDGLVTIQAKDPLLQRSMGQREELSFYDIKLANSVYCKDSCNIRNLNNRTCQNDGYQDPRNCSRCKCATGLGGNLCETVATSTGECGGVINLSSRETKHIESPGYPYNYSSGLDCHWLLQAPKGTTILLNFIGDFLNNSLCDFRHPVSPCVDFVEVRYMVNLGLTGARFCCSDTRPNDTIESRSNQMLVTLHSIDGGQYGFKAKLSTDSCGGCYNKTAVSQNPCTYRTSYKYKKTWQVSVPNQCPVWPWGGPYYCPSKVYVQKERYAIGYKEVSYCCSGYDLNDEETSCMVKANTTTSTTNNTQNDDLESDNSTINDWTSWSECSFACGGCGKQSRKRLLPSSSTEEIEWQSCNTHLCGNGTMFTCTKTVKTVTTCSSGFFSVSYCTKYVTKLSSEMRRCCCNYEENNGICLPKK